MQMNKFIKGIMMALCLVALSVAYVGCEPAKQQINKLLVDDASVLTVEQDTTIEDFEIVIKGMYPDSTEISIAKSDLTITGWDTSTVGEKTLTISYKIPDTDTVLTLDNVKLTVVKKIQSISYKAGSTDSKVEKGSALSYDNLKIVVTYADATTEEVAYDSRKMQVTLDTSTVGPKTMTISYMGKTATTQITVIDIDSIAYVAGSMVTTAYQYFALDTTGASIQVTYTDESTKTVSTGLTFTGVNVKQAGSQNLKIGYKGKETANIAITVLGVTNIEYASGLANSVNQGATLAKANLKLTATYENATNKTIDYNMVKDDLVFTGLDTSVAGDQTLTITLGTLTTSHDITVVTINGLILGFQTPDFVSRPVNLNTYNDFESTGTKGFAEVDHIYVVGNQNEWTFMPKVRVYEGGEARVPATVHTTVKLYVGTEATPAALVSAENMAQYVDVDNFNYQTYKFTEAAAQQGEFTITVEPFENTNPNFVIPFTIRVVNGYNVYNAKDLSILDNVDGASDDDHNAAGKWTTWRNANNVEYYGDITPNDVSTIVLHGDIDLRASDVPSVQFWDKDSKGGDVTLEYANAHPNEIDKSTYNYFKGSVKDRMHYNYAGGDVYSEFVYIRKVNSGTFTIEGNYYTLSIENFPKVQMIANDGSVFTGGEDPNNPGTPITTHATMFSFQGKDAPNENMNTYFIIRDLNLMGNAGRTENVQDSGGLLCIKKKNAAMTIENVLSQHWFINFMNDEGVSHGSEYNSEKWSYANSLTIKKSNIFDSYSTLIYNWSGKLNIEDSHIIGAGGPVMICDHVGNNENTGAGGSISKVNVKNSVLQSWVMGTEGWFVSYGATVLAGMIQSTDQAYKAISDNTKSILKIINGRTLMNLVAVYKSGSTEGLTTSQIRGTFDVFGYTNGLDLETGIKATIASITQDVTLQKVADKIAAIVVNIDNTNLTAANISNAIMTAVTALKAGGETDTATLIGTALGNALAPILAANIEASATAKVLNGDCGGDVEQCTAAASQEITAAMLALIPDAIWNNILASNISTAANAIAQLNARSTPNDSDRAAAATLVKNQVFASVQIAIMVQSFQGDLEDEIGDNPTQQDVADGVKTVVDDYIVALTPNEIWQGLLTAQVQQAVATWRAGEGASATEDQINAYTAAAFNTAKNAAANALYIEILTTVCADAIDAAAQQIATANSRTTPNNADIEAATKNVVAAMLSLMYGSEVTAQQVDLSNKIVNTGLTAIVGALCTAGQAGIGQEDIDEITNKLLNTQIMQTYNGGLCVPGQDKSTFIFPEAAQLDNVKTKFKEATGYTNLYLFNGMAAVFGLNNA